MKKVILILLVALVSSTINGQANKLLRQAKKTENLNEKIALLSQVIELEPNNLDAYFYRAIAKNDLGDFSSAIVDYSKIILLKPDADTYFNRGNSRYNLKNYEGAKEDYQKAFELDASFLDALYSLAHVKFDLGDFEGSIKDVTTLITVAPTETKTYFLRASAYTALEKHTLALNDYSLAILANPSAESYYNRGVFLLNINYYEKANLDFSIALKLDETNNFAYFFRGTTFMLLGNYPKAISDFNTALRFDSLDFDALLGLALTYYKANDLSNAKLYFQKAATIIHPEGNKKEIEQFKNTYWFQNQYFFFNENFKGLANL